MLVSGGRNPEGKTYSGDTIEIISPLVATTIRDHVKYENDSNLE
jgi:hypothetical protein